MKAECDDRWTDAYDSIGNRVTSSEAGCEQADADDDGDVDLADQGVFQGCFNGPNRPPNCLGSLKPMRYAWDAENRLTKAEPIFPDTNDKRVTFSYDHMNRRVRKQVFAWNGTNWNTTPDEDWRFVYDGWNVVEVLNAAGEPQQKYTWGLDLSGLAGVVQASLPASGIHGAGGTLDTLGERQGQVGGLHGTGGVGGLLAREEPQAVGNPKRHWYLYDANGNVGQLLKYVAGTTPTVTLAAHYEYDPYGNTIRKDDVDQSGIVDANPYRFSTKCFHREIDAYDYGYRYYSPRLGRWLSRDPIEESRGPNLCVFAENAPTRSHDPLGMWTVDAHREWTVRAGTSYVGPVCAREIADENVNTDSGSTRSSPFGDYRYHFDADAFTGIPNPGARAQATAIEEARIRRGIQNGDRDEIIRGVGRIIHIRQDVFSHQAGGAATDGSGGHDAATPYQHVGLIGGIVIPIPNPLSPNFLNWERPDNPSLFPGDVRPTIDATTRVFESHATILRAPPCCCIP